MSLDKYSSFCLALIRSMSSHKLSIDAIILKFIITSAVANVKFRPTIIRPFRFFLKYFLMIYELNQITKVLKWVLRRLLANLNDCLRPSLANQNRNSKDNKRYVALLVNVLEYCYYFFFILNKNNYNMDYA